MKFCRCIVLGLLMLTTSVVFASEDQKAGVLDVEVSVQDAASKALANTITRNVRSMIRGLRRWRDVGKLSATLTDAREAFGCSERNMTCMRGLAETLGLKVLVWGTLHRTDSGFTLTLLGVASDGKESSVRQNFSKNEIKRHASNKSLNKVLTKRIKPMLERLMLTPEPITKVSISTEPVGAMITINKESVGTSPVTIALREGSYIVDIQAEGFVPLKEELLVKKRPQQTEKWLLSPMTELGISNAPVHRSRDIIRWTSLGISVTALATAAYVHSQGILLHGDVVDRIQCNQGVYLNPAECGTTIQSLSRQEHSKLQARYQNYQYMQIGGYVLSAIASATFASTFFF